MVQYNFNAQDHKPDNGGFEAIPSGEYQVVITNSQMKPNKKKNGHYLEIECEIIDGEYKSRRLWDRLNLDNPSQEAVAIAQARLSAICHATDVLEMMDTAQLHDKPVIVKVSKIKRADNGEWSNEIKAWHSLAEKRAALTGTPSSTPPWQQGNNEPPF